MVSVPFHLNSRYEKYGIYIYLEMRVFLKAQVLNRTLRGSVQS